MQRRDFLRTAGATAAATGLPINVSAVGAATRTRYGINPYRMAKYTARINKRLTPQMLTQFLGLSEGEASRMIRRLTFEKVLVAPDASGVSRVSTDFAAAVERKRQTLKRLMKTLSEATGETTPVPSDQADSASLQDHLRNKV